jgi:hypothetical protein
VGAAAGQHQEAWGWVTYGQPGTWSQSKVLNTYLSLLHHLFMILKNCKSNHRKLDHLSSPGTRGSPLGELLLTCWTCWLAVQSQLEKWGTGGESGEASVSDQKSTPCAALSFKTILWGRGENRDCHIHFMDKEKLRKVKEFIAQVHTVNMEQSWLGNQDLFLQMACCFHLMIPTHICQVPS